jgi:pimeloyl-ACP methyl ester carboxylesterase
VRIHYRRRGRGFPVVFLHGGWGYAVYPFDRQGPALDDSYETLIPDRAGYGRSTRVDRFARPLHRAGALETLGVLDALGIDRAVLWGHSDGAVMAANAALLAPDRVAAVVLEALHYDRKKPGSRAFFETMSDPERLDPLVVERLREDHGEDYWREVVRMEGEAWLDILAHAADPAGDLYGGRLAELRVPTLVLHGSEDPRTEPGELEAVRALLPRAAFHVLPGAKHSPHNERAFADECARLVRAFVAPVAGATAGT